MAPVHGSAPDRTDRHLLLSPPAGRHGPLPPGLRAVDYEGAASSGLERERKSRCSGLPVSMLMKKKSKVILGVAIVLLLLLAGGAWFLYFNLNTIVARIIVDVGSEATQTKVSVGGVFIDVQDGVARIDRLTVANPDGFSDQPAIALENLEIELDPMEAMSDPAIIERVVVDGTQVLVEQAGSRNNLKTILASIERQASERPAEEADGKKLIIERFELTDASAALFIPRLNERHQVRMPGIVLNDIGRATNGATATSVARQVLGPVIRRALEAMAADGIGEILQERMDSAGEDIAKDLLDRLGGEPDNENPDE